MTCVITVSLKAQDRPQTSPLDDTAGYVHLSPAYQLGLACDSFAVSLEITATDVRVFSLHIAYNSADYELLSLIPGSHPDLHVLPHDTSADTITVDAFFHPNFTGSTSIATLWFLKRTMVDDDVTEIGFIEGEGYSGTAEAPELILFNGDTAVVELEGTPPLAPTELIVIPQYDYVNAVADSVCLRWNPVFYDVDGDTLIDPDYIVIFEDVINSPDSLINLGSTSDTFFYHDFIIYNFNFIDSLVVNIGTYRIQTKRTQP